jgi:hypothetical protein
MNDSESPTRQSSGGESQRPKRQPEQEDDLVPLAQFHASYSEQRLCRSYEEGNAVLERSNSST